MIKEWSLTLQFSCGHEVLNSGIEFNSTQGDTMDSIVKYARKYYMGVKDFCNKCGKHRKITGNTINLDNIIYTDVVEWQEHNYPGETWLRYTDPSYLQRVRRQYGLSDE